MTDNLFRVEIKGAKAELGEVLAIDVANLIAAVERSIAAGAASVLGRRRGVGRRGKAVEITTRLRLVGIERGDSVDVLLRIPEELQAGEGQLPLEAQSLGVLALNQVFTSLETDEPDPQVARTLVQLAADIGLGARYDAVVFVEQVGESPRAVTLDVPRRDRMRSWLAMPAAREADETLAGMLVEADFENMSARLRDPLGRPVEVVFAQDLADEIQSALRAQAEFDAHLEYDPQTSEARRVELRQVIRGRQLELDLMTQRFLRGADIETLMREQRVAPIEDVSALRLSEPTDDEIDGFLSALEP